MINFAHSINYYSSNAIIVGYMASILFILIWQREEYSLHAQIGGGDLSSLKRKQLAMMLCIINYFKT